MIWGFVIKCAVWPLGIVELDVRSDTFYKLLLRFVLCSIDLFPFHGREKGFHDGIVVGLTRFYNHIFRRKEVTAYDKRRAEMKEHIKAVFDENRQRFGANKMVTVKYQRLGSVSALKCLSEC